MAPPGREKAGEAALSAMCSARQLPALSRRVFFSQLAISLSQRSRDSFRGSCSSRRALSSRLAGGDAQCQCSSFFTASQPARAAQPAAIGRTRPQPAGTRFPTRSFRQPARGSFRRSRGCLRSQWIFRHFCTVSCLLRTHVSCTDVLVSLCLYVCGCGLCGAAALGVSHMAKRAWTCL